jgi:hypothetical protein
MNEKLILVKAVMLLYRESLLPESTDEGSSDIIRKSMEQIKKSEVNVGITRELDVIQSLKNEVMEMIRNGSNYNYVKDDLLSRFKLLCGSDENLYEAFYDGFNLDLKALGEELDMPKLKQAIINDRRSLANFNRAEELAKAISAGYAEYFHKRDEIKDFGKWVEEYQSKLEPFKGRLDEDDPAITEEFDIDCEEEVARVAREMSEEISGELGFQFGWQDINGMFNGMLRRGECFVLHALQHNYKTGFSLSMFVQAALFNTPKMIDPTKKPLLLRISFEDAATLNLQFIYKYLYENETGHIIDEIDVAKLEPKVIAKFVKERLMKTGFHIKILKIDPLGWTINDLFNKVLQYEAQGYEVQLCMVDYLPKLPTTGCVGNNGSEEYRNMLERARQFFLKRRTLFMTPWQISPDAKDLIRNGTTDFVKQLPGRGYSSGSKQIDQVLDAELYIHKETYKGVAYLTVQGGKLRRVVKPTDDKTYRVYAFVPRGCIPWDFEKPNSARLKLGGETVSEIEGGGDNWDHFGDI